jgi:hypothetical protein
MIDEFISPCLEKVTFELGLLLCAQQLKEKKKKRTVRFESIRSSRVNTFSRPPMLDLRYLPDACIRNRQATPFQNPSNRNQTETTEK